MPPLNKNIFSSLLNFDFLKEKGKDVRTDCFEENDTSIFDCIFSDSHYYHDKLNRHIRTHIIPDRINKKYYFKITDYFNDEFKLIKKEKNRYKYLKTGINIEK